MPILCLALDRSVKEANPAAVELFGLREEDLERGVPVEELVVPEQGEMLRRTLESLAAGEKNGCVQLRTVRPDGTIVPVEFLADVIYENDTPIGFLAFVMDMRRRTRHEQTLTSAEPIFRTIVEHSHHGFIVVDENYRFVYVNDGMLEILGAPREEVVGHDFREFVHPDSVDMVADYYRRRQRGEKPPSRYRFKIRRKDGSTRVVLMNVAVISTEGGRTFTVAELEDLTEALRNKQALELSRERYRILVETMTDGLGIADAKGRMIYLNPALVRMLGYDSARDLIGAPIGDILLGLKGERLQQVLERRRRGFGESYEARLIHKSGRLIPVLVSAAPLLDADDNFVGSFGIITDLTPLKRAEEEANFLLDLLLHDFGNQMQAILVGLEMMAQEEIPERAETARRYAEEGAERCTQLIEKIRHLEEASRDTLRPVDLGAIVLSEALHLSKMFSVHIDIEGVSEGTVVVADRALNHMIWNILENAVKHNHRANKRVWIRGSDEGDKYVLAIADNGPGMDDSTKRAFLRMERRFGGVGLHLVNRLAARYSVQIELRDRVPGNPSEGVEVILRFVKARGGTTGAGGTATPR